MAGSKAEYLMHPLSYGNGNDFSNLDSISQDDEQNNIKHFNVLPQKVTLLILSLLQIEFSTIRVKCRIFPKVKSKVNGNYYHNRDITPLPKNISNTLF